MGARRVFFFVRVSESELDLAGTGGGAPQPPRGMLGVVMDVFGSVLPLAEGVALISRMDGPA